MPLILLTLVLALLVPAAAAAADPPTTVFPPRTLDGGDCPAGELRLLAWSRGAASTSCLSPPELLGELGLPACTDGDTLVWRDDFGRAPVALDAPLEAARRGGFTCARPEAASPRPAPGCPTPEPRFGASLAFAPDTDFKVPADGLVVVALTADPLHRAAILAFAVDGTPLTHVMAQDSTVTGVPSIAAGNLTWPVRKGEIVRVSTVAAPKSAMLLFTPLAAGR